MLIPDLSGICIQMLISSIKAYGADNGIEGGIVRKSFQESPELVNVAL